MNSQTCTAHIRQDSQQHDRRLDRLRAARRRRSPPCTPISASVPRRLAEKPSDDSAYVDERHPWALRRRAQSRRRRRARRRAAQQRLRYCRRGSSSCRFLRSNVYGSSQISLHVDRGSQSAASCRSDHGQRQFDVMARRSLLEPIATVAQTLVRAYLSRPSAPISVTASGPQQLGSDSSPPHRRAADQRAGRALAVRRRGRPCRGGWGSRTAPPAVRSRRSVPGT